MTTKLEFIAEIGWNFMGDIDLATRMVEAAKRSGATVAKFQYWNPDKLTDGPWMTDGRIEIYRSAALDDVKLRALKDICDKAEIEFLCSAFNAGDAAFLKENGCESIKIPSHEVYNTELHTYAADNFGKVYASLGAGSVAEVEAAIALYNERSSNWIGMHCVSSYPCPISSANLGRIKWLAANGVENLGFSDHTSETETPALSIMLGVSVIEKHFTVDKDLPGRDNKFALDEQEFSEMVTLANNAQLSLSLQTNEALEIEADTMSKYRGRWGK